MTILCWKCGGIGKIYNVSTTNHKSICPVCGGTGILDDAVYHPPVKAEIARQTTSEEIQDAIQWIEEVLSNSKIWRVGDFGISVAKSRKCERMRQLILSALQAYQPKPTSEEIQRAIDWLVTGYFEIISGEEEYPVNSSHHPNTSRFRETAVSALQEYQPWIPVGERFPTKDDALYHMVFTWSEKKKELEVQHWRHVRCDPGTTHWKPLPEPPKGEVK